MSYRRVPFVVVLGLVLFTTGCDDLLGSKSDDTTQEIFEEGRIPPQVFNEVEYVPLFPFFTQAGDGASLQAPQDVYVGYDELIYVIDERGLHILDQAGRPQRFVGEIGFEGGNTQPLRDVTSIVQDRRLHLYVAARRDTTLNGRTWDLPVVYRLSGLTTGAPRLEDIIWHPFDEDSRKFNRPDPIETDEDVEFTGVGVLYNNSIYVSRRGPVNDVTSVILPHNTVLEFTPDGINTQALVALSPTQPSLRSAINPSDVMTFVHPPQRSSFSQTKHFVIAQSPGSGEQLRFGVLSIVATVTPDGIEFRPDSPKLQVAADPDRGDGFLYEEFKFQHPVDLAFAADETNYLFVLDAAKDSLFAFTAGGIEGVAAPAGSQSIRPVPVSFGGTGDGALQFSSPQGVAYFDRVVYVADTGNNRISRFKLNTDFE